MQKESIIWAYSVFLLVHGFISLSTGKIPNDSAFMGVSLFIWCYLMFGKDEPL